jgi:hypothetical protein
VNKKNAKSCMLINCNGAEIRNKINYTTPPGNKLSLSTPIPLPGGKHNGNRYKNQLLLSPIKGPAQLNTEVWSSRESGEGCCRWNQVLPETVAIFLKGK